MTIPTKNIEIERRFLFETNLKLNNLVYLIQNSDLVREERIQQIYSGPVRYRNIQKILHKFTEGLSCITSLGQNISEVTFKHGIGLERKEINLEILTDDISWMNDLFLSQEKKFILNKNRTIFPVYKINSEYTCQELLVKEVVFDEIENTNFKILELEFWNKEEAETFSIDQIEKMLSFNKLPENFYCKILKEITEDQSYSNYEIAKKLSLGNIE